MRPPATRQLLLAVTPQNFSSVFFSSRRRHTRCLSDSSSDVCSSDLSDLGDGSTSTNHVHRTGGSCVGQFVCYRIGMVYIPYGDYARSNGHIAESIRRKSPLRSNGRSEERRVGKECRSGWWGEYVKVK